jgi:septum formation protein
MENDRESQAGLTEPIRFDNKMRQLVLASSSPRRAEILRSVGWEFEILPVDIDETPSVNEAAIKYVERLALEKAEAAAKTSFGKLVLGADTTVVVDGDILGKPTDGNEARSMLRSLSGRWHEVLTGVALVCAGETSQQVVAHQSTRVQFAKMSDDEINWYVATGEPMGKAGAYAIQGRAALFIEKIEGDYWNVVGLPVRLVYCLIGKF